MRKNKQKRPGLAHILKIDRLWDIFCERPNSFLRAASLLFGPFTNFSQYSFTNVYYLWVSFGVGALNPAECVKGTGVDGVHVMDAVDGVAHILKSHQVH